MDESKSAVTCSSCGSPLQPGAKYCGFCGGLALTPKGRSDPYYGQVVAGRYRIKNRIAEGGMGEVYVAEHETLSQRVAVKLLHRKFASDEKLVARFFNEARTHSRVKHPNAVSLLDFGRLNDGTLYLVTEFIEGISLTDFVHDRGPLPPALAVRLITQIGEVLAAVHAEQIVHRDLKPDNVLVSEGPGGRFTASLIDFGIAKVLDDSESRLTQTGAVFGTPEYMSPEQAQGLEVSYPTDIYALGCMFFFMLAGRPPFEDRNRAKLIQRQIKEPPPLDLLLNQGQVPSELVHLVQDCLRKQPDERPRSALDVLSRLEEIAPALPEIPLRAAGPSGPPVAAKDTPVVSLPIGVAQDLAAGDTVEIKGTANKSSGEWEKGAVGLPTPRELLAGPIDFTFDEPSPPPVEEEFTLDTDDDSPLAQIIDVDPSEFAPVASHRSHLSTALVLIVLVAAGALTAVYFGLLAGDGTGGTPADAPDAGGNGSTSSLRSDSPEGAALPGNLAVSGSSLATDGSGLTADGSGLTGSDGTLAVPAANPSGPPAPGPPGSTAQAPTTMGWQAVLAALNNQGPATATSAAPSGQAATATAGAQIGASLAPLGLPSSSPPIPQRPLDLVGAAGLAGQGAVALYQGNVGPATEQWATARDVLTQNEVTNPVISLATNLERVQDLIYRTDEALAQHRCRAADELIVQMRQISPNLRRQYLRPLNDCNQQQQASRQPAATLTEDSTAPATEATAAPAETTQPRREESSRRRPPRSLE